MSFNSFDCFVFPFLPPDAVYLIVWFVLFCLKILLFNLFDCFLFPSSFPSSCPCAFPFRLNCFILFKFSCLIYLIVFVSLPLLSLRLPFPREIKKTAASPFTTGSEDQSQQPRSQQPEHDASAAPTATSASPPQQGGDPSELEGVPPGGDEKQEIDGIDGMTDGGVGGNWGLSATAVVEVGDFDDEDDGGAGGAGSRGGFDEEAGVSRSGHGGGKKVGRFVCSKIETSKARVFVVVVCVLSGRRVCVVALFAGKSVGRKCCMYNARLIELQCR